MSTCPSDHEACWWFGDDIGMHNGFWVGIMIQFEGRIDMHLYKFILENFL